MFLLLANIFFENNNYLCTTQTNTMVFDKSSDWNCILNFVLRGASPTLWG